MRIRCQRSRSPVPFVLLVLSFLVFSNALGNQVNSPPNPFSLIAPSNGAHFYSETITFVWNRAVDSDPGDQVTYDLWISPYHRLPDTLFTNLTDTSITLDLSIVSLLDFYSYTWRVSAKDQWGESIPSVEQWHCSNYPYGNADGIPPFGAPDISDVVFLINFIFGGGPAPNPI